MTVLISNGTIVKAALMGKPETAHQLHGITNKISFELPAVLVEKLYELVDRNMPLCLQKDFQHLESIFKIIDFFLFKKLFKLFLFLNMSLFHLNSQSGRFCSAMGFLGGGRLGSSSYLSGRQRESGPRHLVTFLAGTD